MNAVDQAVGGWLIDQAGNPTYYDISANETSYNYIVANQFYNADVVSKANNIYFPMGSSRSNRAGASSPPTTMPAAT